MGAGHGFARAEVIEAFQEQAYEYDFAGKNVSIFYSTPGPNGGALLSYRWGLKKPLLFGGDEIRVVRTEIAQLVTVTLRQIPDLKTKTFTLLIPSINLNGRNSALFETTGFITSHHTTIAGPDVVEGPIQTYVALKLLAQVSPVDFFSEGRSGVIGKVTISPTCPGPQQPGQKCVDPFPDATVQILDSMDQIVGTAITDSRGLFAIRSEPGDYTIYFDLDGIFPRCPPTPITVLDGLVAVTIDCDTGIR